MLQRDKEILSSLEKFKCLERDQIATLHFSKNKNPIVNCNRVLKRLRTTGYIQANTNRSFQQYIYFLNPSVMKTDSQKINHFLRVAQGYIDMKKYSPVSYYNIEPKIKEGNFIPDVKCKWMGKEWYVEFQNSLYTTKQLYSKLDKYVDYFNKGYWNDERVLIIGKINFKFDPTDYPFKVIQVKDISELEDGINEYKRMMEKTVIKCNGGKIEWKG